MKYSIQTKLIQSISLLIMLIGLFSAGYGFYTAKHDAIEWQDDYLTQVLKLSKKLDPTELQIINSNDDEENANLYIVKLPIDQNSVYVGNKLLFTLKVPITTSILTVNTIKNNYRVAIKKSSNKESLIVAQNTVERDELIWDNTLRSVVPIVILIPLIILLIKKYIIFLFTPITQTSALINTSNHDDFSTISLLNLPKEIHPFVKAINQLLMRVADHIFDQQKFIAEAAHELRSPLTALSLQADRLNNFDMSEPAKKQLHTLITGITRNKKLVAQLLTFATVQQNKKEAIKKHEVIQTITDVIEDLMPLILDKNLDVGIVKSTPFAIKASGYELNILFKNLLGNAIKFSPNNSIIDINILHTEAHDWVEIIDSGSGITQDEMTKVFSPFYRTLNTTEFGTGLGLSIVKTITDKIGATIAFENITNIGLKTIVTFNNINEFN